MAYNILSFAPLFGGGKSTAHVILPAHDTAPPKSSVVRRSRQTHKEIAENSWKDADRNGGLVGVSQAAWNLNESGTRRISVDSSIRLCELFGVSLDWIYRGNIAQMPLKLVEKMRQQYAPRPRRRLRQRQRVNAARSERGCRTTRSQRIECGDERACRQYSAGHCRCPEHL